MKPFAATGRFVLFLATIAMTATGCSWWNSSDKTENAAAPVDQPGFSVAPMRVLPVDAMSRANFARPNSFVQTVQELVDTEVDRSLRITTPSQTLLRRRLDEPLLQGLSLRRNVLLPRQQLKRVGALCFIPAIDFQDAARDPPGDMQLEANEVRIHHQLIDDGFGGLLHDGFSTVRLLRRLERLVVIVSTTPENMGWWRSLNSFNHVVDRIEGVSNPSHPCVLVDARNLATDLPSNSMAWDVIGVLIWNDGDPALMPSTTKQALVDWIAAGGTLLINTPAAAQSLVAEPFAELMPLKVGTAAEEALATESQLARFDVPRAAYDRPTLGADAYAESITQPFDGPSESSPDSEPYVVEDATLIDTSNDRPAPSDLPVKSSSIAAGAAWVSTQQNLIAERHIGRGRVLATTFDLNHEDFRQWDAVGNWFHTVVMRLPPRHWDRLQNYYAERGGRTLPVGPYRLSSISYSSGESPALAANDNDVASTIARPYVQSETKIKTPARSSVLRMMLSYIGVVVVANYVLFRLIDRVQWAWIALPILAVAGVVFFIRALQLEIGFNRSQQGMGVLQIYSDYPRAHLSQFTSVYSSLSESVDAVLPPESGFVRLSSIAVPPDGSLDYRYADRDGEGLVGFPLRSQTAAMIHSEEIVDCGGSIEYRPPPDRGFSGQVAGEFVNHSEIDLRDAFVVYNSADADLVAAIGDLPRGATAALNDKKWISPDKWDSNMLSPQAPSTALADCLQLATSESTGVVLIGWTDRGFSQLQISPPRATQENRTVVYGTWSTGTTDLPSPDTDRPPKFLLSQGGG